MLATLKVRDLVLIEDVELDFLAGLNVLTGETGAGKSILLDALGLAAGVRAGQRAGVRQGAAQGSAVAIFDLPPDHAARAAVSENGLVAEGDIILRRSIGADGRTRAFINDEPVGIGLLRDLGSLLVEIHGQADDRGLFDTSTHRKLLDAFGGHEPLAEQTASAHSGLESERRHAEALRDEASRAAADLEYLRLTVTELSALAPQPGEEQALAAERALLMNAGRIAEDISAAVEALGGERGAESCLSQALKRLGRSGEQARAATKTAETGLEQAFALTEEARRELEALLSRLEVDSGELEKKEERLFALRAASRKFAVPVDELPRVLSEAQSKLDLAAEGGEALKAAEQRVAQARAAFREVAGNLAQVRKSAARDLESAVARELAPLKLGHARFRVALEPVSDDDAGPTGLERVSFEVATIEGATFGPLARIASGGELARFSLALKVALAGTSPPAALIFDEVDRGVGGAVADAVGERLQRLAKQTQVLLVTHAPQVAARAERHFRIVRKRDRTLVELLGEAERVEEIARMLAGATVTEEARANARRLLSEAREASRKPMRKRA